MVFTGKPSTACATCKKRRIKCDEARPSCGQCIKSKRECMGYVNRLDLLFRDETTSTVKRASTMPPRAQTADVLPKSWRPTKPKLNTTQARNTKHDGRIPASPTTHVVEQASLHFLANFVMSSSEEQIRGNYSYFARLLQTSKRPYFTTAYEAVALASLSNVVGGVERQALAKYTKALSLMASAIRDPIACRRDDIIAASVLLGLYETVANIQFGSMAWGSHIQGTIALCKMRSRDILNTKQGRDLMTFVKEQFLAYFFTAGNLDTRDFEFWMNEALIDDITSKLQSIAFKLGTLRAQATKYFNTSPLDSRNVALMTALMEKCKALDQQFIYWSGSLPDSFRHKSIRWEYPVINNSFAAVEVFPGKVNMFPSIAAATLWCKIQNYRNIACCFIMFVVAWRRSYSNYETDPEYMLYFRQLEGIVTELVASIPYHLKWFDQNPDRQPQPTSPNTNTFVCGVDDAAKSLGGINAIWPLTSVLSNDASTPEQRAWAQGRFRYIAKVLGIRAANGLSALKLRLPSSIIRYHSMTMKQSEQDLSHFEETFVRR